MKFSIKKESLDFLTPWLDTPIESEIDTKGEEFSNSHISGWIVGKGNICLCDEVDNFYYLNKERIDVALKVLKNNSPSHNESLLGFAFNKKINKNSKIYIVSDNSKHLWLSFSELDNEFYKTTVKNFTSSFTLSDNSSHDCSLDNSIINDVLDSLIIGGVEECISSGRLHSKTIQEWRELANFLHDGRLITSFNNGLIMPCLAGEIHIIRSLFGGGVNFVECCDSEIIFYLIQVSNSGDAIYLPHINTCIVLTNVNKSTVSGLLGCILKSPPSKGNIRSKHSKLHSLLVSHSRPYHHIYDGLLGLELFLSNHSECSYNVSTLHGENFIDPTHIYGACIKNMLMTRDDISKIPDGTYIFRLGLSYPASRHNSDDIINRLDERLINSVANTEIPLPDRGFPVIWLGVTGQKRSWVEQIDGYSNIINEIYKKYPSVSIFFDGWTSPISPTNSDEKSISEDREVIQKIKDRIPRDIPTIILAGASVETKITHAKTVNFFISNYMTGSMIISRIARKPGIGHMSNASEYMAEMHHHHHIYRVEKSHVSDIEDVNLRADFISYSIKWQHLYKKLTDVMDLFTVK